VASGLPVARMKRSAMRERRIALRFMRATGALLTILLQCDPASAQTIDWLGGFYGGLLHPVRTPTHGLALLGLGLLIGQQPADRRRLPQVSFVLALAGGLVALALAVGETPAGEVLLLGGALSGALAAAAFRLPLLVLGPLALAIGAAIGLDSPPEVISVQEGVVMLIGTGLGATIALALVVAAAARMARDWQRIGVRVLGSWTAASALLAIAVRFARS
jgi:urease accessory protein